MLNREQTGSIDPNTGITAFRVVYETEGGRVLGCLGIPAPSADGNKVVDLSSYSDGVPAANCG